jgi:hypothetical protein
LFKTLSVPLANEAAQAVLTGLGECNSIVIHFVGASLPAVDVCEQDLCLIMFAVFRLAVNLFWDETESKISLKTYHTL